MDVFSEVGDKEFFSPLFFLEGANNGPQTIRMGRRPGLPVSAGDLVPMGEDLTINMLELPVTLVLNYERLSS